MNRSPARKAASACRRISSALLALWLVAAACAGERPPGGGDAGVRGVARVWAIHDGEKIARDDLHSPFKGSNRAWNGHEIKLFGARNEVLAFQLIVEAGCDGVEGLAVGVPRLSRKGGGASIEYAPPGPDPTESRDRPIQVFVEHSMYVTEVSRAGWVFDANGPAAPRDPTGWRPVQLVPENARRGRGGVPIDVPPRTNQAFWIEIYADRDLPPGIYEGAVEVRAGGEELRVPLELELFDFTLPDEDSMEAMLYFEPEQVELYQGRDLQDRYHRFAHRHRVELVNEYDPSTLAAAAGRFDGSDFTQAEGYEGPGEGVGNRIAAASFYGVSDEYLDPAAAHAKADAWMESVHSLLPDPITFLYVADEPGPADYPRILQVAANVKSSPGPGKALPTFVTTAWTPALDGAVDICGAFPGQFDVTRAAEDRARRRRYWFYNGQRPHTGAIVIDTPATDARANLWAAFKHGVEVYFYWHAAHWRHNTQKQGERNQNVWANPVTFDNRGQPNKPVADQGFLNGDGVLMYPGEEVLHPEQDRGIAGPVGTVQLGNLRRGLQDHQYLSMARALGLDAEVDAALAAVVPAVFSEAGPTVGFAEHGDAYEQARYELAQAIAAASARRDDPGAGPRRER